MYKTILMEEITLENATEKINEKVQEMEKDGYQIKTIVNTPLHLRRDIYSPYIGGHP